LPLFGGSGHTVLSEHARACHIRNFDDSSFPKRAKGDEGEREREAGERGELDRPVTVNNATVVSQRDAMKKFSIKIPRSRKFLKF
jgi:hypothetical protein